MADSAGCGTELARKIDINPNSYTTREQFMHWIVRTLYLEGNGNAVVYPDTRAGIITGPEPDSTGAGVVHSGRLGVQSHHLTARSMPQTRSCILY